MTTATPNLDQLRTLTARLAGLLADPQPGLYTWKRALAEVLVGLGEFTPVLESRGAPPALAAAWRDEANASADGLAHSTPDDTLERVCRGVGSTQEGEAVRAEVMTLRRFRGPAAREPDAGESTVDVEELRKVFPAGVDPSQVYVVQGKPVFTKRALLELVHRAYPGGLLPADAPPEHHALWALRRYVDAAVGLDRAWDALARGGGYDVLTPNVPAGLAPEGSTFPEFGDQVAQLVLWRDRVARALGLPEGDGSADDEVPPRPAAIPEDEPEDPALDVISDGDARHGTTDREKLEAEARLERYRGERKD